MTDIRRSILWVVFVFSLIMIWDKWQLHNGKPATFFPDPQRDAAALSAQAPSPTGAASTPAQSGVPAASGLAAAVPAANASLPEAAAPALAAGSISSLENENLKLDFSSIGGNVVRAELKKYAAIGEPAHSSKKFVLLDESSERVYRAESGLAGSNYPNHLSPMSASVSASAQGQQVRFESAAQNGIQLIKTYTLPATGYALQVRHEVINTSGAPLTPELYLQLTRDGNKPPGDSRIYSTFTGPAFYTAEKKYQKVDFSSIEDKEAKYEKTSSQGYVSMVQHYFASAWLLDDAHKGQKIARENYVSKVSTNLYAAGMKTALPLLQAGQQEHIDNTLYIGPQDEAALEGLYPGLEAVKDYGIFTILSKPLFKLMHFLHGFLGNWGWTIVALVVLLKIALYWLNAKAYSSMAKMKAVTPRITEMRERLKDKPQEMQMEMMRIYKEEKVNPIGGCLPMLVQIPIFIALYWVLLSSVEFRGAPWMGWITDLSAADPYFILPLLMTATSLLQVWLNPTPPDPMQAKLMWMMPLLFSVMFFFFPSGLVLYWLTNNILSIAQQWIINRRLGVN